MIKQCSDSSASTRKRMLAISAVLVVALAGFIGSASPAMATPKGKFAVFADCPLGTAGLTACVYSQTKSGEVTISSTKVPINKTIVLQGGIIETEDRETEVVTQEFVGAKDGNTLAKVPLKVPGGLLDLVKCSEISNFLERIACELVFETGATEVTATTELAAPASSIGINEGNILGESGTALSLPVKIKLSNVFLGGACYIGSNAHPVVLNLTTGTSGTLKGSAGTINVIGGLLTDTGSKLVDNTFEAPKVNGCGGVFSSIIDPIVDGKVGLPSGEGNNKAVLEGTLEQAGAKRVEESETE
jgi:hypothetical protein